MVALATCAPEKLARKIKCPMKSAGERAFGKLYRERAEDDSLARQPIIKCAIGEFARTVFSEQVPDIRSFARSPACQLAVLTRLMA